MTPVPAFSGRLIEWFMALRLQLSITVVVIALLAAGWFWFSAGEEARSSEKPDVRQAATLVLVEAIELTEDRVSYRAVGTGEALRSASIYASVDGEVMGIGFGAEQRVERGATLLRLDDRHERLAVRLAEVAVKEAEREVKRLEKLVPSGAVSRVRLETAEAELESTRLRLDQAEVALSDRTVFAPFTGVIGLSDVEVGDRITDDTMIATLDDRSSLLVEFNVPEEFAGRVTVGDPITVQPWTLSDTALMGSIEATGSRIDPITRSLKVKARVPNPDQAIRPGTSFEVHLDFVGAAYPKVREVAILWSRDGAYVWKVAGSQAEKVFVDIVRRNEGEVLVDGGLQAGDLIVVEGVQGLRQGQELDPRPYDPAQAGTAPAGPSS